MNVSEYIFDELAKHVDTVFFLPGGGANFLVDALGRSGLKAVAMLHEQGAGYAAVGYAMHKGLGVCLVTSGPGATNAITPCLAAWMDSVPVVFISGQVRTDKLAKGRQRFNGVQEGPTFAMVRPITKDAVIMQNGNVSRIANLIELAKDRRMGPVWIDVPQDVQAMEAIHA